MKSTRTTLLLLTFVLAVAIFFRLYKLSSIPFGLNNDAAWDGSAAIDILRGNWKDYIPYASQGWRGEALVRITIAFFTILIGHNPIVIKLGSVVFGLGIIIPLFFLIWQLFNPTLAFLTTFSLAVAGWPVTMSKVGWQAIEVPFFSTLAFLFAEKALEKHKPLDYFISAVATAGALYTYNAGRIVPVIVFVYLVIRIVRSKNIRAHIRGLTIFVLAFLFVSFPMTVYIFTHWENYWSRDTFLFIGNDSTQNSLFSLLFSNIKITALMFTHRANGNDFFISEPLLDPPMIWLFPLGVALALFFSIWDHNKKYIFMLSWFLVSLLPGIFSIPNGNRSIGAIPSVYFFVALAMYWLAIWASRIVKRYKKIVLCSLLTGYCLITSTVGYETYLGKNRRELPGFYPETQVACDYIKTVQDTYDIYLTDNFPRELLTYDLYRGGNPFAQNYTWFPQKESMLTIVPNAHRGILFVLLPTDDTMQFTDQLLTKFPHSRRIILPYHTDSVYRDAAIIVEVPPQSETAL